MRLLDLKVLLQAEMIDFPFIYLKPEKVPLSGGAFPYKP